MLFAHGAAQVHREDDILVRLGLELPHGQIFAPRRCAPVHVPELIAAHKRPQPLELRVAAAGTHGSGAGVFATPATQHLEGPGGVHVGVHVHRFGHRDPLVFAQEPKRPLVAHGDVLKRARAPLLGRDLVAHHEFPAAWQRDGHRHGRAMRVRHGIVGHRSVERARAVVVKRELYRVCATKRPDATGAAPHAHSLAAKQRSVAQGQRREETIEGPGRTGKSRHEGAQGCCGCSDPREHHELARRYEHV